MTEILRGHQKEITSIIDETELIKDVTLLQAYEEIRRKSEIGAKVTVEAYPGVAQGRVEAFAKSSDEQQRKDVEDLRNEISRQTSKKLTERTKDLKIPDATLGALLRGLHGLMKIRSEADLWHARLYESFDYVFENGVVDIAARIGLPRYISLSEPFS